MDPLISFLGYSGVFVFAISGALAAVRKEMDLFGVLAISFLPALGGGTVRDLVLDLPVFWLGKPAYIWLTVIAALLVFFLSRLIESRQRWLVWADALGLSLFAVIGAERAFAATGSTEVAVIMGVVTAVAGGILRDIVCNDVPLVLHGEIYATAAFAGAGAWCLIGPLLGSQFISLWMAVVVALGVRSLGIVWHLTLPRARRH